jgi:hypothetical protein
MRSIRLVTLAVLFGVATACGGNDTEGDGQTGPSVTVEELPAKYAAAVCEVFTTCAGDLWEFFRPGEDCVKQFTVTAEEELSALPNAIDSGRVKYHGTKIQKCLDDVVARGCEAFAEREPESCEQAIEGTVKEGGSCTMDEECAGKQYCKLDQACPGKCAPYEQAGGACESNDHCASGLKCGDNKACVAPAKLDEACEQGEPDCGDGLICLGQDSTAKTPGTCREIEPTLSGKLGDACSLEGPLCAAEFSCEITKLAPISGECVAKVGSGEACKAAFPDECPIDEYCALANPLLPGTCTPKPQAGEKCAAGLGDSRICEPYARCDADVCREIAHAGETCNADDTCYSGHCVNEVCVTGSSCR